MKISTRKKQTRAVMRRVRSVFSHRGADTMARREEEEEEEEEGRMVGFRLSGVKGISLDGQTTGRLRAV